MSYIALIPEDAAGDEHLTLAWFKPRTDMGFVTSYIPAFNSTVRCHELFGDNEDIPVAVMVNNIILKALHRYFAHLNESEYGFVPHITQTGEFPLREIGSEITFNRIELRE